VVESGQPIVLPGQGGAEVIVHPGDMLLGDADGVVVIPGSIAAEVVAAAAKLERLEKRIVADIKRGIDREVALKRADRSGHIRKLVPG
jgi:regulator of RNase E activity RraA